MAARAVSALLQQLSPGLYLLAVRAKPGARSTKVVGPVLMEHPQVEVRVGARPVDGQANSELVEHLEQLLQSWVVRSQETLDASSASSSGAVHETKQNKKKASGGGGGGGGHTTRRVTVELVAGSTSRDKVVKVAFPGSAEQLVAVLNEDAE